MVDDLGGSAPSKHMQPRAMTDQGTAGRPGPDPGAEAGRRRARRIVIGYAAVTSLWLVASTLLAEVARGDTSSTPVVVTALMGGTFVVGTSAALWHLLRGWATRLTEAAEVQRRAAENLTEVNRLRAAFLDSISHELRTPLTSINGFAQTIRAHHETLTSDQIETFAERLVANSSHLERLVTNLLDLHREDPAPDEDVQAVHVEQLLRAAVTAAEPNGQRLHVWCPAQWVQVDGAKLERIVAELVGNIMRHTPPGTVAWLQGTTQNGHLYLGVEDDGPGVDETIIDSVSQPFVQGDQARESPTPGLGIGLALAARYAEQLGGTLQIVSPDAGGTRVEVVLPFARARSEERIAS